MALYFLSYDLRGNRDYEKLYNEHEKFNAVRMLESNWCFIRINTTAIKLRDYFITFIDNDDGLVVSEVALSNGVNQWGTYGSHESPNDLK